MSKGLTRRMCVHVWLPKGKAVIEGSAFVLCPQGLKPNARIDAPSTIIDMRGDQVMEGNSNPLAGSFATKQLGTGDVVVTRRYSILEARSKCTISSDEYVLKARY